MLEQQGGPDLAEEVEGCDACHQMGGARSRTSCYGGREHRRTYQSFAITLCMHFTGTQRV